MARERVMGAITNLFFKVRGPSLLSSKRSFTCGLHFYLVTMSVTIKFKKNAGLVPVCKYLRGIHFLHQIRKFNFLQLLGQCGGRRIEYRS